jgi:hypothetical protein
MILIRHLLKGVLIAVMFVAIPLSAHGQGEPPPPGPVGPPAAPEGPPPPPPLLLDNAGEPKPVIPPDQGLSAQGPFANLMSPTVGHLFPRADFHVTWFPDEPVRGQPTNLGYTQESLSFNTPFWQDGPDEWAGSIHVLNEHFNTSAILPNSRLPFPDDLWNIRVGTSYRHLFDNGWIAGGTLSVGSASDEPFNTFKEMTFGVNAFLRIPQGEHNAWLFSLNYSPTSELPFPIPGVAYIYQPTDYFRANLGLPFALWYRPIDDLTLDFSYMLLRTVHARATYRVYGPVRVYGGFDWSNESYFLADRANENDRFFYYDKRLTGGVQVFFSRQGLLDVFAGYDFDRFYFQGAQYADNQHDRIDVGNGAFLGLRFEMKY